MTSQRAVKDLIIVTADSQMQTIIETLLQHRRPSLGISEFSADVVRHRDQDPGCRTASGAVLNPSRDLYHKAMVVFDFDGSGENHLSPERLERQLEQEYQNRGWGMDRVTFVVIAPELEAWIFGASYHHLQNAVRWDHPQPMRDWLASNGHLTPGVIKPTNPKAAIEAVLDQTRQRRGSRLYAELARNVSLAHCQDRAFRKFRSTLHRWFPAG